MTIKIVPKRKHGGTRIETRAETTRASPFPRSPQNSTRMGCDSVTYMHSFYFLDFLLQRFIKRSSESEDKIKRLVYAFSLIPLQSLTQSMTKKFFTYTLYRKSTRRVINGMMKREIQNTKQEYNMRSCNIKQRLDIKMYMQRAKDLRKKSY